MFIRITPQENPAAVYIFDEDSFRECSYGQNIATIVARMVVIKEGKSEYGFGTQKFSFTKDSLSMGKLLANDLGDTKTRAAAIQEILKQSGNFNPDNSRFHPQLSISSNITLKISPSSLWSAHGSDDSQLWSNLDMLREIMTSWHTMRALPDGYIGPYRLSSKRAV